MTTLTTFANQSGQIPLSQLDSNFATPITIGTTVIILGDTATTISGLILSGANLGTPTGNLANCTFPILNQNTTGTASNVTTNANLTGAVTSVGNATSLGVFTSADLAGALTDETGSGSAVFSGSPTFTGNVTLTGNISVGGATPTTSGTGITFPATQSASSNANTLDDYEEGTWTPVLTFATGTITYTASSENGSYTKIGNLVTCKVQLILSAFSAGAASGAARISLPFTVGQNFHTGIVLSASMTTLFANLAQSVGATSYVNLFGNTAINVAPTVLTPTNFTATSNISFSISYTV